MWIYKQSTGQLFRNGEQVGQGYSGHAEGKNNPDMQDRPDVGPIPQGQWCILEPRDTMQHGPFVMPLIPKDFTETFGRSGFLMHGDSSQHPGMASLGCIIMPRPIREKVNASGDHDLEVIA